MAEKRTYQVDFTKMTVEGGFFGFGKYEKGTFTRHIGSEGRIQLELNVNVKKHTLLASWYDMDGKLITYFNRTQMQAMSDILSYISKHGEKILPKGWFTDPEKGADDIRGAETKQADGPAKQETTEESND